MNLKIINIFLIILIVMILSGGCSKDEFAGTSVIKSDKEILIEANWKIIKVTYKYGTQDPDAIVPEDKISIIQSGSQIEGIIDFKNDGKIELMDVQENYLISEPENITWELQNDYIRFRRVDSSGNLTNAWGYHLYITPAGMKWYISGIGIESGEGMVEIIDFHVAQ